MRKKSIGAKIKELRIEQGLTQQDLAVKSFLTVTTISRAERDQGSSKPTLQLIAQALSTSVDQIKGDK